MEAIRKQATKLREQVARQQQVHAQKFFFLCIKCFNYLNYKYDGTLGFVAKVFLRSSSSFIS